jgi:hypothetical protein
MVIHPEFSKLLHDAGLVLKKIGMFNLCSCHGARICQANLPLEDLEESNTTSC